jgi:AcrR family transcriptional regulator
VEYYNLAFTKIPQEKRDRVLQSAIVEFADHGFESANINKIALNAGISIGSIYAYFTSKENLFLTVIHYGVETLKAVLDEIIRSEDGFLIRLEKIVKAIQSYSRTNVHLTKIYNEMTTENHSELVWKIVSDMENVSAGLYAQIIEEAQLAGLVRKDANAKLFAFFLDNLFIMLQFSYACEYYKERLMIFVGEDVIDDDDLVAGQLLKFIKGAFLIEQL